MKAEGQKWTPADIERRDQVLERIRDHVAQGLPVRYQPKQGDFAGTAGDFSYVFEGEDDLLHLRVERQDGAALEPDETQPVAMFLLPEVPEAMVWLRPGARAHHYYLGHDLLLPSKDPEV